MNYNLYFILIFILTISINQGFAEIQFEDVTDTSGITYVGKTWGCSWSDFNNDMWADFFCGNHGNELNLFQNNKNGTFSDLSWKLIFLYGRDPHGSAWSDFDNDGDKDLIVLTGAVEGKGERPNLFFVNNNGSFTDSASEYSLDNPLDRGRTPLWFDFDSDGLLDIFLGNFPRSNPPISSMLLHQNENGFIELNATGIKITNSITSAQISDINQDGKLNLVFMIPYFEGIYDIHKLPFENISQNLEIQKIWVRDLIISDFDGDMSPDFFLTRAVKSKSLVIQENQYEIKSVLRANGNENGFNFKSTGDLSFDIYLAGLKNSQIFIGAQGWTPENSSAQGWTRENSNFTISSNDPLVFGLTKYQSGIDSGVYIGYDNLLKSWNINFSSKKESNAKMIIKSNSQITQLTSIGFLNSNLLEDKLLINKHEIFEDVSTNSGLDNPTSCISSVAGDFDNDMDLDIYLVCSNPIKNLPNILYENMGNGTLVSVSNSGGAQGSILGVGDTVSTADYDNDGFLDILITNGAGLSPFADNGPTQLFRNLTNENNWIEIDLIGTHSNRDGIGSKIIVIANGTKQIREQNGGMHNKAQNNPRIHVGLGDNTIIDEITIYWPSGIVNNIKKIPSNQILQIVEPKSPISPHQQLLLGIKSTQILCKDGLQLVIRSHDPAVCVKPSTQIILESRGWVS